MLSISGIKSINNILYFPFLCIFLCCEWQSIMLFLLNRGMYPCVTYSIADMEVGYVCCRCSNVYQVFVQCSCVSCHCGRQSAVVQSRVWYRCRGDLQIHMVFFVFGDIGCESGIYFRLLSFFCSIWDEHNELRSWSGILTIPVKSICRWITAG